MSKITPSKAKNSVRRALFAEIEGALSRTDKLKVWEFFRFSCTYCGRMMDPSSREGHMDHLASRASGGTDHIGNTVLACRVCNGDEKRDMQWQRFLRTRCLDDVTFDARRSRIEEWVTLNRTSLAETTPELAQAVEAEVQSVFAAFDRALSSIRKLKRGAG